MPVLVLILSLISYFYLAFIFYPSSSLAVLIGREWSRWCKLWRYFSVKMAASFVITSVIILLFAHILDIVGGQSSIIPPPDVLQETWGEQLTVVVTTENEFQAAINDNTVISIANDINLLKAIVIESVVGLTILGNNFELNGLNRFQCFYIAGSTSHVDIQDLTMKECKQTGGGGSIQNTGGGALYVESASVILRSCRMLKCGAEGSYPFGGAVMVDFGYITIYDSLIDGCKSGIGGGIASLFGNVEVYNTNLTNNVGDYGGAISMFVGGKLHVNNSIIQNNKVFVYGGGLYGTSGCKMIVNHTTFQNNSAYLNGGGVSIQDSFASFTQCDFIRNHADQSGGAIESEDSTLLVIYNNTRDTNYVNASMCFSYNTAIFDGGAIFATNNGAGDLEDDYDRQFDNEITLEGNIYFKNNQARRNGGALFLYQVLFLDDSDSIIFDSNIAGTSSSTSSSGVGGSGGAFYYHFEEGTFFMSNAYFINNICSQNGGALFIESSPATPQSELLSCKSCDSDDNKQETRCLYMKNSTWRAWNYTSQIVLSRIQFINNSAIGSGASGGGLSLTNGRAKIKDCLFDGNIATTLGGGIYIPRLQYDETTAFITFKNTLFKLNNVLSGKGDDLYSQSVATIKFDSGTWFEIFESVNQDHSSSSDVEFENSGEVIWSDNSGIICPVGYMLTQPVLIDPYISFPLPSWNNSMCLSKEGPCSSYFDSCYPPMLVQYLAYNCSKCSSGSYSFDQGVFYGGEGQGIYDIQCYDVPYGGDSINGGSELLARPGFYGALKKNKFNSQIDGHGSEDDVVSGLDMNNKQVKFVECPVGFCCENEKKLCSWDNTCAGNRQGILCGKCQPEHSISLLDSTCVQNKYCHWTLSLLSIEVVKILFYCILFYFNSNIGFASPFALIAFYDQFFNLLSISSDGSSQQSVSLISYFLGSTSSVVLQGDHKFGKPMCSWLDMQPLTRAFTPFLDIVGMLVLLVLIWFLGLLYQCCTSNTSHGEVASSERLSSEEHTSYHNMNNEANDIPANRIDSNEIVVLQRREEHFNRLLACGAQVLNFSVGAIASACTQLLTCTDELPSDNESRLIIDGDVKCYTTWQIVLMIIMIIMIVLVSIPLIFALIYEYGYKTKYVNTMNNFIRIYIKKNKVLKHLSNLATLPFKQKYWYWLSVMTAQRICLAGIHVTVSLTPTSRSLWAVAICTFFLVFHSVCQPFKDHYPDSSGASSTSSPLNSIQTLLLACTVLIASLNIVPSDVITNAMNTSNTMNNQVETISYIKTLLLIVPMCCVMIWWMYINKTIVYNIISNLFVWSGDGTNEGTGRRLRKRMFSSWSLREPLIDEGNSVFSLIPQDVQSEESGGSIKYVAPAQDQSQGQSDEDQTSDLEFLVDSPEMLTD